MPAPQPETWGCPICNLETFAYGKTCPLFKSGECANIQYAHLTGQVYVKRLGLEVAPSSPSIGIAQISDEGM